MMKYLNDSSLKLSALILLIFLITGCASPTDALYDFKQAFHEEKWDKVWSMLTQDYKKDFEENIYKPFIKEVESTKGENLKGSELTVAQVNSMSAKDFFIYGMKQGNQKKPSDEFYFETECIRKLKNESFIKLRNDPREYHLKKEMGIWKISM